MGLDPHGEPKLQGSHLLTRAVVGVPVTRQRRCRRPGKHPATIPWKHPEEFVPSMGAERRVQFENQGKSCWPWWRIKVPETEYCWQ
jgi:hypothetical protein